MSPHRCSRLRLLDAEQTRLPAPAKGSSRRINARPPTSDEPVATSNSKQSLPQKGSALGDQGLYELTVAVVESLASFPGLATARPEPVGGGSRRGQ
jgi:hypothetical protein